MVSEEEYNSEVSRLNEITTPNTIWGKRMFLAKFAKSMKQMGQAEIVKLALDIIWTQFAIDLGFTASNFEESKANFDRVGSFVFKQFSDLSILDVETACDMYVAGELDNQSKMEGHFQKLNTKFILQVLDAYRKTRLSRLKTIRGLMPPPEEKKASSYDIIKAHIDFCESSLFPAFDLFKKKGDVSNDFGYLLPTIYWSIKGVAGFFLSEEEQRDIRELAKKACAQESDQSLADLISLLKERKSTDKDFNLAKFKKKVYSLAALKGFDFFVRNQINLRTEMGFNAKAFIDADGKMIASLMKTIIPKEANIESAIIKAVEVSGYSKEVIISTIKSQLATN